MCMEKNDDLYQVFFPHLFETTENRTKVFEVETLFQEMMMICYIKVEFLFIYS